MKLREEEYKYLENDFALPTSTFTIVTGRKNVGKSEFIVDYINNKNSIYINESEMIPILFFSNLAHKILKVFNIKEKISHEYKDFISILNILNSYEGAEKLILVFDDFDSIKKVEKNALNILIDFWNNELKNKNVQLIILLNNILETSSSKQLKKYNINELIIKDLPFNVIKQLFPNISRMDEMYIYSVFGTSMKYLRYYDTKKDFLQNLYALILSKNSIFFNEGFKILKSGVNEIGIYGSIIYAIARGNNKIGEIASFLNLQSTYLTRYIQKLNDMYIIQKSIPLNEKKTSKFGRYEITDNFIKFWFLYVYPNYSYLKQNKFEIVFNEFKKTFSNNLIQPAYKKYIYELISDNSTKYLNFEYNSIGSWWNNTNHNIDMIAYDKKNITFIKILWENSDKAKLEFGDLKHDSEFFKTTLKKNYIIITKETFFNLAK